MKLKLITIKSYVDIKIILLNYITNNNNTKIRINIIKYSQMYTLTKQFSDKFNKLYTKSMNDNKTDKDEYNE